MKELLEEINSLSKEKSEDDQGCLVPTDQVEQSLKLLADLKLEESLGGEIISKLSDPEGAQIKLIFFIALLFAIYILDFSNGQL